MELINKLPKVRGSYRFDVKLSKTNWFNVGGNAKILFKPKDIDDLRFFLQNKDDDLDIFVIGVGSNIIIQDGGIDGVVIKLGKEFAKINHQDNILTAGAGALCSNLALYSKINALSNLEFVTGIPGGVGGMVAMNAGCYGDEIADFLISALVIDNIGNILELENADFNFSYRENKLAKDFIILEARFRVENGDRSQIGAKITQFNKKREESQPIRSKTGGSTFKNPKNSNKKAWQLIDESGCRGLLINDAQISEKHCNFMINNGKATASDLINLGNLVIDRVKEKTGITLEWEIKIIGKK
ncbi:UDP-N-acetylmuramate dehydrogenase [Rickettsiales bacterium]|nr:UDP-N-acetylmuramate dehydrogenase [Rickettsiales bacterium]